MTGQNARPDLPPPWMRSLEDEAAPGPSIYDDPADPAPPRDDRAPAPAPDARIGFALGLFEGALRAHKLRDDPRFCAALAAEEALALTRALGLTLDEMEARLAIANLAGAQSPGAALARRLAGWLARASAAPGPAHAAARGVLFPPGRWKALPPQRREALTAWLDAAATQARAGDWVGVVARALDSWPAASANRDAARAEACALGMMLVGRGRLRCGFVPLSGASLPLARAAQRLRPALARCMRDGALAHLRRLEARSAWRARLDAAFPREARGRPSPARAAMADRLQLTGLAWCSTEAAAAADTTQMSMERAANALAEAGLTRQVAQAGHLRIWGVASEEAVMARVGPTDFE